MKKEKAIERLMAAGMTEKEAIAELNEIVRWYLRGTGYTPEAVRYATKCAVEDILDYY